MTIYVVSNIHGKVEHAFFCKKSAEKWVIEKNLDDIYPQIYSITQTELGEETPEVWIEETSYAD